MGADEKWLRRSIKISNIFPQIKTKQNETKESKEQTGEFDQTTQLPDVALLQAHSLLSISQRLGFLCRHVINRAEHMVFTVYWHTQCCHTHTLAELFFCFEKKTRSEDKNSGDVVFDDLHSFCPQEDRCHGPRANRRSQVVSLL